MRALQYTQSSKTTSELAAPYADTGGNRVKKRSNKCLMRKQSNVAATTPVHRNGARFGAVGSTQNTAAMAPVVTAAGSA